MEAALALESDIRTRGVLAGTAAGGARALGAVLS